MATSMISSEPLSSGEFQITDPDRCDSVDRKHRQIATLLEQTGCDAMLLQRPENIAWMTSGGQAVPFPGSEPVATLLITRDARVVLCNNCDSGELFDRQITGLGFLLKERPWQEPKQILIDDVCRGRKVAGDGVCRSLRDESAAISQLRLTLDEYECRHLRELAKTVAHAVEATTRNILPGETEAEIAGHLAHRLLRHEAVPCRLSVAADGRSRMYRHWSYSDSPLRRWAVVSAMATRGGLTCGVTRTVCFGHPPEHLLAAHRQAAMIAATGMYFSQVGETTATLWEKLRRIFEKIGQPQEWQAVEQGALCGYLPSEQVISPKPDLPLAAGMAIHWTPSVGGIRWGETVLVRPEGAECCTFSDQWPALGISVRGQAVNVADLLCREVG